MTEESGNNMQNGPLPTKHGRLRVERDTDGGISIADIDSGGSVSHALLGKRQAVRLPTRLHTDCSNDGNAEDALRLEWQDGFHYCWRVIKPEPLKPANPSGHLDTIHWRSMDNADSTRQGKVAIPEGDHKWLPAEATTGQNGQLSELAGNGHQLFEVLSRLSNDHQLTEKMLPSTSNETTISIALQKVHSVCLPISRSEDSIASSNGDFKLLTDHPNVITLPLEPLVGNIALKEGCYPTAGSDIFTLLNSFRPDIIDAVNGKSEYTSSTTCSSRSDIPYQDSSGTVSADCDHLDSQSATLNILDRLIQLNDPGKFWHYSDPAVMYNSAPDLSNIEKKFSQRRHNKATRLYRCKQCDYVAKSKDEHWLHYRSHINLHKLLSCPNCPFVTEHKHHFEYHIRNHVGSKPFKCAVCSYSCINKAMLKSHMKSHTDHCEYRCAHCNYATKYCHSLKMHLRKHSHNDNDEELIAGQ